MSYRLIATYDTTIILNCTLCKEAVEGYIEPAEYDLQLNDEWWESVDLAEVNRVAAEHEAKVHAT